jgi:signal transduction histidine kinase
VFDPFFTTKPPGAGTGLGLEVARTRVRANGGDIQFDSRPGRTEFRVLLPLRNEKPES